ncbi:MAG: NAD-dependent dehydratase [Euryarchaeota archaeon]|jgi:nucleoside-diphosphate-sugar epimerase|nr:NAD-dependent dehydratase [Euryarchaeota archaeon]HIK01371.1 NAD-dependent epimerase/dehydratase family protein [Candidatus Undinarchaeales archaeon ERR594346 U_76725]|tara:strand:+ start:34949 stop:36349 length:1401 start_codon:yes stop_codon:yes gene_type:complete
MSKLEDMLIDQSTSIKEAMRIIDRAGVRMALIVDDNQKLKGIVTDGDIRRGIIKGAGNEDEVSTVMNKAPLTTKENVPHQDVLDLLKTNKVLGIPVLSESGEIIDMLLLEGNEVLSYTKHEIEKKHLRKILVIGGAGYIGSVLVRKLLDKGYKVKILDNFLYGDESLSSIESDELTLLEGDTRHIEDVTEAVQDVDAVVHLAELVGDPASNLNPKFTQDINYLATRNVASVCKHFHLNRLVYASSCSVYGASEEGKLLTEESSLNPVSLYAKMKISSEKALVEMKDDSFRPTILRLGTVFGPSPRPRFDLVVNLLTAKAVRDGKITIFGGDQWRPNVHVEDVAESIISVLEAPLDKVGGEVFNVGSEKNNHTINELGNFVKGKVPSAELIIEEKDVDKRDYKVDFTKLREGLELSLERTVDEGISGIISFLEDNKDINYEDSKYSNVKFLEQGKLTEFFSNGDTKT